MEIAIMGMEEIVLQGEEGWDEEEPTFYAWSDGWKSEVLEKDSREVREKIE